MDLVCGAGRSSAVVLDDLSQLRVLQKDLSHHELCVRRLHPGCLFHACQLGGGAGEHLCAATGVQLYQHQQCRGAPGSDHLALLYVLASTGRNRGEAGWLAEATIEEYEVCRW